MSIRYTFAHRGGRAHGSDNTLATFREALARGATGLETDAWLTADGVVVLDHDGALRAARREHTPIAQVRRADLPAHIPTLDELYTQCGTSYDVAIDVRVPDVALAVVDVAVRHRADARLWLVGGTTDLLEHWRDHGSSARLAMSVTGQRRGRASVGQARAAGAQAVNMRWPWWSAGLVRHVHDEGLLAFGYDVQWQWAVRRCERIGIDGLFSDHVDRMRTALRDRG